MDYTELIGGLRNAAIFGPVPCPICDNAADAIKALQAEIERLKDEAHQDGLLRVRYAGERDALQAEIERLKADTRKTYQLGHNAGAAHHKQATAQRTKQTVQFISCEQEHPEDRWAENQMPDTQPGQCAYCGNFDTAPVAQPAKPVEPTEVIEALCARIKAADDAAADRDYMLDSDDCIAVIRGTWKAPLMNDKPVKQGAATEKPAKPVELTHEQLWEIWDEYYADTPSFNRPDCEPNLYRAVLEAAKGKS